MRKFFGVFKTTFVVLVALVLLAGCSIHLGSGEKYSRTDLMFAQMMIPHHQQAVEMSELAIEISDNSAIIALAKRIKSAQAPEIDQMQLWLDDGDPGHMGHDMMEDFDEVGDGMMGMLDDGEIDQLRSANGVEFDQLFLKGMIAHHEGAIDMAKMIDESKNDEVRALGKSIISTQKSEIEEMKALLAAIS